MDTTLRAVIAIRRAEASDVPTILALVRELAAYEKEPDAVVATEADLLRDGFPSAGSPRFHVLLATAPDLEVVGFAFYFFTYSTWVGRPCLHLEDLFVRPAYRGRGAGLALMRELAKEAVTNHCRRFVWQVLDWNAPAIAFYEGLGAKVLPEWQSVRLEGEALAALAERC